MSNPPPIPELLDRLESFYGPQQPSWPTDPYLFLVWWHCGYPASDTACAKGWAVLTKTVGTSPEAILAASPEKLAAALKPGGMVPEIRALRLKQIAARVKVPTTACETGGKPDCTPGTLTEPYSVADAPHGGHLSWANIVGLWRKRQPTCKPTCACKSICACKSALRKAARQCAETLV